MALTEETIIENIEITGTYDFIQIRSSTIIKKDGQEIARNRSLRLITPGQDVSAESAKVQAIAQVLHTQEIIDAYQAHLSEQSE